jgi:hypothetical protein
MWILFDSASVLYVHSFMLVLSSCMCNIKRQEGKTLFTAKWQELVSLGFFVDV